MPAATSWQTDADAEWQITWDHNRDTQVFPYTAQIHSQNVVCWFILMFSLNTHKMIGEQIKHGAQQTALKRPSYLKEKI